MHANGKWLYSINETAGGATTPAGAISAYSVDQTTGTVVHTAVFPVPLPAGCAGDKNGSEIEIDPSGKHLYVSMRLDNIAIGSIVAYSIDATTGTLTFLQQESSRGVRPRQFTLSKDGTTMVVGNQNSDNIAVFRVDATSKNLTFSSASGMSAGRPGPPVWRPPDSEQVLFLRPRPRGRPGPGRQGCAGWLRRAENFHSAAATGAKVRSTPSRSSSKAASYVATDSVRAYGSR